MKPLALIIIIIFGMAYASQVLAADDQSFEIICKRNIFDANRRPEVQPTTQSIPLETPKPVRREYIRLTGTVLSSGQSTAFFSGEVSGRKAVGDSLDDLRIEKVNVNDVLLQGKNTSLTLAVGKQIMRENEGPWQISESAEMPVGLKGNNQTKPDDEVENENGDKAEEEKPPVNTGSLSRSEILKRMMERRQKELD